MAIDLSVLRAAARRSRVDVAASAGDARQRGVRTAFLCHSHKDADYVEGLLVLLREAGWQVYVDWKDSAMPAVPNTQTAANIRGRIRDCDYFLFLATPNACASRWCPWEIGIADGIKNNANILVIPTRDGQTDYGNEYLGLYRRIDIARDNRLAAWRPGDHSNGVYMASV